MNASSPSQTRRSRPFPLFPPAVPRPASGMTLLRVAAIAIALAGLGAGAAVGLAREEPTVIVRMDAPREKPRLSREWRWELPTHDFDPMYRKRR